MVVCSFIVSKAANGGKNKNTVASSDPKSHSPQENIWVWLRQTQEKIARMGDNSNLSPVLEARTGVEPVYKVLQTSA